MYQIAILHTTSATVQPLGALIRERIPGIEIQNFVDDSILPMLMEDIGTLEYAYEKLLCYARFAQRQGARLILNACSSVGEFSLYAKEQLTVPLLRIDDPVSDLAAARGSRIAVLATLPTTLAPSCKLVREKQKPGGMVTPVLVEGAYAASKSGDKPRHDALIAEKIIKAAETHDVVYLAQASMADAAVLAGGNVGERVLFSTVPAVEALAQMYQALR